MVAQGHWRDSLLAALAIIVATTAAYWNSFSVPLLLDDHATIGTNPQLNGAVSLLHALKPPEGSGVGGRPIASLAFALNAKAVPGSIAAYHGGNLLCHITASMLMFAVLQWSLRRHMQPASELSEAATPLALAAAIIWATHPLQTESVTYISQRTESLMGVFYLATLYCFVRSTERSRTAWQILAVVSCALGMATKEGMVSAPITLLLYDVLFISGSFRTALRQRCAFYVSVASTWLVLGFLMHGLAGRGVGLGKGMELLDYVTIEFVALVRYARLALWPADLVFDYGTNLQFSTGLRAITGALVFAAVALVVYGVVSRRRLAFVGAWFFLTLGPTSSFVPIPLQPIAENRAYLASASIIVLFVLAAWRLTGSRRTALGVATASGIMALVLSVHARNRDYESADRIWSDTVAKMPTSARAHNNLAVAHLSAGRGERARREAESALTLDPAFADAHTTLAGALGLLGKHAEAEAASRRALALAPNSPQALYYLGVSLCHLDRFSEAITPLGESIRARPVWGAAYAWLASALVELRRFVDALAIADMGLAQDRRNPQLHIERARALAELGRLADAIGAWREAVVLDPANAAIQLSLGTTLVRIGQYEAGAKALRTAIQLMPNSAPAHCNLASALWALGKKEEAIANLRAALRIDPSYSLARENLQQLGVTPDGAPTSQ